MKHLENARINKSHILLYIAVPIVAFLAQAAFMIPTVAGISIIFPNTFSSFLDGFTIDNLKNIDHNIALVIIMLPMAFSLGVIMLCIRFFNKQKIAEVINGRPKVRWKRIQSGFICWIIIMSLITIISYIIAPEDFILQLDLSKFIPLIILSLLLIPLQTTFEELLFRGYLAQGVATLTRNRWVVMLIPSLIFALMHMTNPEVAKYGTAIMFASYFAMAFIWALISTLDDGIEIAIGMHAANNIFISLLTSQKDAAFVTEAVFEVAESDPYLSLVVLIITNALAMAYFYRKYNWSFAILNKKIKNPVENTPSIS